MDSEAQVDRVIGVGVREPRCNLTRYLREARDGASILVTSHDTVIAEIHPPAAPRRPVRVSQDRHARLYPVALPPCASGAPGQ